MEKMNRTEITFETDRTFVISKRARPPQTRCADCAQPSAMVTTEEAVHATGLTSRAVYRALETGKVHFAETPVGLVLFCLNSISLLKSERFPDCIAGRGLPLMGSTELEIGTEVLQIIEGFGVDGLRLANDAGARKAVCHKNELPGDHKRKAAWFLTPDAFERLLDRLDKDRERAGQTYEEIRRRIVKYFQYRGCRSPEDLADETIDRVAKRISEGREIWTSNPASYFYGVARNVLKEHRHAPERDTVSLDRLPPLAEPWEQPAACHGMLSKWTPEVELEALEHSMSAISAENRELILEYYRGEKGEKIRNRHDIATRLGIPPNALRIRVHRIREKLESHVRRYLCEKVK